MIKIFKFIALFEGLSLLVLFSNMLMVKPTNFELYKNLLFPIGMVHGLLFIAYIVLATYLMIELKWNIKKYLIIVIASFLPFGTFFIEKKYLKTT